jgi:hypothetical protein
MGLFRSLTVPAETIPAGVRMPLATLPFLGLGAGFLVAYLNRPALGLIASEPAAPEVGTLPLSVLNHPNSPETLQFLEGHGFTNSMWSGSELAINRALDQIQTLGHQFDLTLFLNMTGGFVLGGLLMMVGIHMATARTA